MRQPVRKGLKTTTPKTKPKPKRRSNPFHVRKKPENVKYGTSKLERDFAKEFLDRFGLVYIYQYEAKDIKRFFDFAVTAYDDCPYIREDKDGINCVKQEGQYFNVDFLIEVDGSYHHADPRLVKEGKLNPMQKHNKFVDSLKDRWARDNHIPLLRIWEYDIRHDKRKVIEELSKFADLAKAARKRKEHWSKPH